MKLNPDCIRDILLAVEEIPDINHHWRFDKETVPELLPNYSFDEVMYHIRQCQLNEFFFQASGNITGTCYTISDLSPKGHEFLANIRNDSFYNKVKDIGAELGVQSLKADCLVGSVSGHQITL